MNDFQVKALELDVEGAREYFDAIINPVPVNFEAEDTLDDNKFTEVNARQILENAQLRLELYGKLASLITKYCNNREIKTGDANDEIATLGRCLKLITIYITLSTSHSTYLIEAAAKIQESGFKESTKYSDALLEYTKKRLERDNKTLGFLSDPMQSYDRTRVIYELYSHPGDYKDIIEHLLVINDLYSTFQTNTVVVCRKEKLQGLCRAVKMKVKKLLFLLYICLTYQPILVKEIYYYNKKVQSYEVFDESVPGKISVIRMCPPAI